METLDTGKYIFSKVGDEYIQAVVYSDLELTVEEVPAALEYFRQFDGRVPLLVNRKGRYALSSGLQLAFIKHAKNLFSAMGFLDYSPLQRRITQIASITYLRDLPVKSFSDISQAQAWLKKYGPLPPFKAS